MDVLISITGTQRVDGEEETIELTTAGGMEPAGEGWTLTYDESAATGMEGVTTTIRVHPDEVLLERTGSLHSPPRPAKGAPPSVQLCHPLRDAAARGCIRASCAVPLTGSGESCGLPIRSIRMPAPWSAHDCVSLLRKFHNQEVVSCKTLYRSRKTRCGKRFCARPGRPWPLGELPAEPMPAFVVEVPGDRTHGDYAVNAAMVSARAFRRAPRQIADALLKHLDLTGTFLEKAEVAGPGFLNFFSPPPITRRRWRLCWPAGTGMAAPATGREQKGTRGIRLRQSDRPHAHRQRPGGALGDGLASVLSWAGYEVSREFYINDAGNQIEKFGRSLEARYLQLYREGIEMPEEAYLGQDIVDHAKAFAAKGGTGMWTFLPTSGGKPWWRTPCL